MAYNPNIPQQTNRMVNSQVQIRTNFQTISSVFARNHVQFNSTNPGSLQGMHNVLTFRAQTINPTTSTSQISLFTKTTGANTDLFYAPSNSQTPIQLTYPSISTGLLSEDPDVYLPDQYSFMAGPFVVYMGNFKKVDGSIVTLLPATTLIYVGLIANGGFGTRRGFG